jgi:hypothetical protein
MTAEHSDGRLGGQVTRMTAKVNQSSVPKALCAALCALHHHRSAVGLFFQ